MENVIFKSEKTTTWNKFTGRNFLVSALTAVMMVFSLGAGADDIDIYRDFTPNPLKPPLVVITLDLNVAADDVL